MDYSNYTIINLDNQEAYTLIKINKTDMYSLRTIEGQGCRYSLTGTQVSTIMARGKHKQNTVKLSFKSVGIDLPKIEIKSKKKPIVPNENFGGEKPLLNTKEKI